MRRSDSVDVACEEWAVIMRDMVGLTNPRLAKDYIGALRCTLAARRDLHHGSTSSGRVEQHFPEFPFRGYAAAVNTVYKRMPEPLQEILVAHYVAINPRSKSVRADLMGLSLRVYWDRVGRAKATVEGALSIIETVRTVSPSSSGISRMSEVAPAR